MSKLVCPLCNKSNFAVYLEKDGIEIHCKTPINFLIKNSGTCLFYKRYKEL